MVMFEPESGGQKSAEMWGHIVDDILTERGKFPPAPLLGSQLMSFDFDAAKAELLYKETIFHIHKANIIPKHLTMFVCKHGKQSSIPQIC